MILPAGKLRNELRRHSKIEERTRPKTEAVGQKIRIAAPCSQKTSREMAYLALQMVDWRAF